MSWKQRGDYYAVRTDGVIAEYIHQSATFPYAVHRVSGAKFEWMKGTAKSSRTFRTLTAAMRAADKTWPLK